MTITIFVDSRFCTTGTDSSFHIELRESVNVEDARLRVDKIRFIDSFYTVESNNRYLYTKSGEGFAAYALPIAAYTGQRLASTIQSLTGKTATYSDVTNSISIAHDEATRILSDEELREMPSSLFPEGASPSNPKSINRVLGPSSVENGNQVFSFISMQPFTDVYLRSRRLTCANMHAPDGSHDVICKIPLSEGVGKTVVSASPENVYYDLGAISLRTIDFQLTDVYGTPVNLRGRPLSFQLTIDQ